MARVFIEHMAIMNVSSTIVYQNIYCVQHQRNWTLCYFLPSLLFEDKLHENSETTYGGFLF